MKCSAQKFNDHAEFRGSSFPEVDFSQTPEKPLEAFFTFVATHKLLTPDVAVLFKRLEAIVTNHVTTPPTSGTTDGGAAVFASVVEAFTKPFLGREQDRLLAYLTKCWEHYCQHRALYAFPYTTIVQSSGFGKSRLLRELAVTSSHKSKDGDKPFNVLYLCVRENQFSTGFPRATKHLAQHFFPTVKTYETIDARTNGLSRRLWMAFELMMEGDNWNTISSKLLTLFDQNNCDQALCCELQALEQAYRAQEAQIQTDAANVNKPSRILWLAIDEARALLPREDGDDSIGWFRILRRALSLANVRIGKKYGPHAGIFAVLVDTNSQIANTFARPPAAELVLDPSSRGSLQVELFPPFVLTNTIDLFLHASAPTKTSLSLYQEHVVHDVLQSQSQPDDNTSCASLSLMGRPLWNRCGFSTEKALMVFAATKLLGGVPSTEVKHFTDKSMNGVASMLCRLGMRPNAYSPLASRVVADFMAVLSYVSHTRDQHVCSYSSDPILTLGATCLWYEDGSTKNRASTVLEEKILPELRKLLHQHVMDTGEVGEMVAQIVLLLAMDACGELRTGKYNSRWEGAGTFCSVYTLLTALHGESPHLYKPHVAADNLPEVPKEVLAELNQLWGAWRVSFTHFVPLDEVPTEDCLWAMLARRAAGAFPRGHKGADFVIPICPRLPRPSCVCRPRRSFKSR